MSRKVMFDGKWMSLSHIAQLLGNDPSREEFERLYEKLPIKHGEQNQMTQEQLAVFFDALPGKCLEWAFANKNRYLVCEAMISAKRIPNWARTTALLTAFNDAMVMTKCVLGGPYEFPGDIYGESLLKLLATLEVLAGGKRFIRGIPSDSEIKMRMAELLLMPHPRAIEIQEEAFYLADSLRSAVGRGEQARAARIEKNKLRSLKILPKAA